MKKSDIAMIVLIASVSAFLAFAVANSMPMFKPPSQGSKVKTIDAYNDSVEEPDETVFNGDSINPTVKTIIGSDKPTE